MTSLVQRPVEIIFIDDKHSFLEAFARCLNFPEGCSGLFFTSADHALTYINSAQSSSDASDPAKPTQAIRGYKVDDYRFEVVCLPQPRVNEVLAIISDYYMPEMNGIEFFNQVKDRNIKRVLLSGMFDDGVSEEAMSKGIIHQFIGKGSINYIQKTEAIMREYADLLRVKK